MTGFNGVGPLLPHSYTIGTDFVPKSIVITDVTNADQCVVTTDGDHGYSTGWVIQIIVPSTYGMFVPGITSPITVLSPTTFSCDHINTAHSLPFVTPTYPPPFTSAQAVPISGVTFNMLPTQGPW